MKKFFRRLFGLKTPDLPARPAADRWPVSPYLRGPDGERLAERLEEDRIRCLYNTGQRILPEVPAVLKLHPVDGANPPTQTQTILKHLIDGGILDLGVADLNSANDLTKLTPAIKDSTIREAIDGRSEREHACEPDHDRDAHSSKEYHLAKFLIKRFPHQEPPVVEPPKPDAL